MTGYYMDEGIPFPETKAERVKLIGTRMKYLRKCDIDHSGRGYIFPRIGTLTGVKGRECEINGGFERFKIVEYIPLPPEETT